jgi:hypothetical protein
MKIHPLLLIAVTAPGLVSGAELATASSSSLEDRSSAITSAAEDAAAAAKKAADAAAAQKAAEDEDAQKVAEAAAAAKKSEDETRTSAPAALGDTSADAGGTAPIYSPVQASARPFDLAIASSVQLAGSNAGAANFQLNVLPSITDLINANLRETVALKNATALMLEPSQLRLATDSTIRVYFVGEGAGYHNTLAYNLYLPGVNTSDQAASRSVITPATKIIFPDASSSVSLYDPAKTVARTAANPLLPGDFVDLGNFKAGGRLDLALIANGAYGGKDVFVASPARNDDHITHVVTFALKNSPYLIAAFEDLRGGGDRDYNDVVVAIDVGRANVAKLISAPAPPLPVTLAALLGVAAWWRRRLCPA